MTSSFPRQQLALNLKLRDASSFANFFAGRNREAFERIQAALRDPEASRAPSAWLYLWGECGTGKTHLLEAACRTAQEAGLAPLYIPLKEKSSLTPAMFEDAEQASLVCVDDLDAIRGDIPWERALFALYERLRAQGGLLIVAARVSPAGLGLMLPDLATRLAAGLVYQLQPLSDEERIAALRLRAERRGLDLSEDVARYVLTRYPRDTHALFALLDRIDLASLAAQRRITIPFVANLEDHE